MAIFASTTTPYSAPNQALTIKALEKRQADMQAQMAQANAITPENTQTPVQGMGHLANIMGDRFQMAQTEAKAAAGKAELAKIIAGYNPDAPDAMARVVQIGSLNPELAATLMQNFHETKRDTARYAHEDKTQANTQNFQRGENELNRGETRASREQQAQLSREQMGVTTSEGAATRQNQRDLATQSQRAQADLAKAQRDFDAGQNDLNRAHQTGDKEMQIKAQENLVRLKADLDAKAEAAKPTSTQGGVKSDVNKGILTPEEGAEALKPDPIKAAKAAENVRAGETEYRKGLSHIQNLEEAKQHLEKGIYSGALQSVAPVAGGIPGASMFVDKEKAQRTSRFNTIVGEDAIRDMSTTLKGSSTNYEMNEFKKMKNDPNISDEMKAKQLERVIAAAKSDLESQAKETKALGGDTERIDRTLSGGGPAPAAVKEVASEAEAKALPPNTRFKLPDGRTGTTK